MDLINGPLKKLLELLDTQVLVVRSEGPVGDFLDIYKVAHMRPVRLKGGGR